jgi:hypothetical protein
VRLSPLGTSATNWPIVPAPDGRWWVWSSRWNENLQGKSKYSEKTCPSCTLSTSNSTWPDLGSNLGRRCEKPATNRYLCDVSFYSPLHYEFALLRVCPFVERPQTKFRPSFNRKIFLKCTTFLNPSPWNPLKNRRRFYDMLSACFFLGLPSTLKMKTRRHSETPVDYIAKAVLFIMTAVSTSNTT